MRMILIAVALFLMGSTANAENCEMTNDGRVICRGSDRLGMEKLQKRERQRVVSRSGRSNSVSLAGIVAPLSAKVQEIVRSCGSRVVSAYRSGARIPSGHLSNHARHRAVDLRGNPKCIYAHLKGWPGGYSADYARAPGGPHVHISYNRKMEWGARFRHTGRSYHARARR